MSLRARVLAGVALIAVVLAVVVVVITKTTKDNLVHQVDAELASTVGPARNEDFGPHRQPPRLGDDQPRRFSSLYVGYLDGGVVQTVAAPNLGGDDQPLPLITAAQARAGARTGESFTVDSEDSDLRYRVRTYRSERTGTIVALALPLDHVDNAVARLITVELLGVLVILAALGLVAWWVVHLGVRPVKRMTGVATAIASGDLSQRVPEDDPRTEAGQLGIALNQMLGHIEAAFDERTEAEARLRQFIADASHELRTPVATIRGYAELYRAGGLGEQDQLTDAMRRTEQEATRMGQLVDDLLHLARLDQGRPLESQPVDLSHLADDAARDARAVDPSRPVEAVSEGTIVVKGNEGRLRQVIANVVGNALVHTPAGTPIEIRTQREDGKAVVAVTDHGPGMPETVAARAFERFFRADPARSRHQGGSGLGLAIVDATVRAHGGTAAIQSAPGKGTTVRIELPLGSVS